MKWRSSQRGRRRSHESCHHSPCNETKNSRNTHHYFVSWSQVLQNRFLKAHHHHY
ncbi:hypothetical protein N665_0816s0003 [Sinapis alba]|nr:hypothetical protein N665_0816s0003 [Sinapis alba]